MEYTLNCIYVTLCSWEVVNGKIIIFKLYLCYNVKVGCCEGQGNQQVNPSLVSSVA